MSGKTHAMIGANAIWIAALVPIISDQTILLAIAGSVGGLLPDIDAANAKIHYVGGGSFGAFRNLGKHRGFFHSLIAIVLILIVSLLFFLNINPLLPVAITIGYASHILLDALNKPGVQLLFPKIKRYRLLPRAIATNVNGHLDTGLFILGALTLVLFIVEFVLPNASYL